MDVCLARSECNGRVGDGDSQIAVWTVTAAGRPASWPAP